MFSPIHPGQILKPHDTVIVAVSGGADSMVLLHWLWANYSYKLIVAHLNHGIRKEAKKEEEPMEVELATVQWSERGRLGLKNIILGQEQWKRLRRFVIDNLNPQELSCVRHP